jgi:formylglycine-generating enzyme required for sulfatase activity
VKEGEDQNIALTPPTPITGVLALSSTPLGAGIKIDGKDYGTTPRNITDLLIGQHTVTLSLSGYNDEQTTVEVKEQQTTDLSLTLKEDSNKIATATAGASLPKESKTFTVKGVSFVMVFVEGGTFQMGVTSNDPNRRDEMPVHNVTLSSYHIGQTEVTQALWQAVMGSNPSWNKGDNLPVEKVSWNDCQMFITKLNQLTGQKFRLPTEAEWEYAARGGKLSKGYKYSGSNTLSYVAWYTGNSSYKTHPVATKRPNELGLYDMSGNVWEWCQDWYGSYSSSTQSNPTGPSSGSDRVLRGGSWDYVAGICRVSNRLDDEPSRTHDNLGFRLALSE